MKKLSGIICDSCRKLIRNNEQMTNEDWKDIEENKLQLCPDCENPIRLKELELAKDYLNSDYYWRRKRELEEIHSHHYYDKDRNKPIKRVYPTTQTSSNEKDGEDWNNLVRV